MNYILYPFYVVLDLVMTLIAYVIAPILPIFTVQKLWWCDNHSYQDFGPRLSGLFSVFQTPDNDLYGDATFQKINGKSYWSMVKWLWRNPAYSFGLRYLTSPYFTSFSGDKTIKDNDNAKAGWCLVHANGLFQFTSVTPIGFSRCIYVNLGWNIRALVDDNVSPKPDPYQSTFVFSPRISGFR